ncbi:MAG: SOS response-associated peptidase [Ktedonobacterales bacterium]|nr:SOS response-associated peptidase [Ktedonobacterales bacterium]
MCGRYVLDKPLAEVAARFAVAQPTFAFAPSYNIAPGQPLPVVVEQDGQRELRLMHWGLVPLWSATAARPPKALINARAEGIAAKPSFRRAVRTQRVLVPARGYYEWQATAQGKQPYFIHRPDGDLVSFAGLYEVAPAGGVATFTIITCPANALTVSVHQRMPALLRDTAAEAHWLDATITEPQEVVPLLQPYPSEDLAMYPVSKRVSAVANNGPALIINSV